MLQKLKLGICFSIGNSTWDQFFGQSKKNDPKLILNRIPYKYTNFLHQFNLTCNVFERVDFYSLPIDEERKNDEICIFSWRPSWILVKIDIHGLLSTPAPYYIILKTFKALIRQKISRFWIFLVFKLLLSAILNISNCPRVTIGHPV